MMGRAADTPLITEQHTPLKPHMRVNPPLAVRKRIHWPDGRTQIADEPYWDAADVAVRLYDLDALYQARGYTLKRAGKVTTAMSEANSVSYWVEWII